MTFLLSTKKIEGENKLLSAANWEKLRIDNINNSDYVVIDVRTPEEYNIDGIPGAINIDYYNPNFKQNLEKLDYNKKYLIYCRSGSRSGHSAQILKKLGFNYVYDLDGGMTEYSKLY